MEIDDENVSGDVEDANLLLDNDAMVEGLSQRTNPDIEQDDQSSVKRGDNTIVIIPGSMHFVVGRATDYRPKRVLHCIARRLRTGVVASKTEDLVAGSADEIKDATFPIVDEWIRASKTKKGASRPPILPSQFASYNKQYQPEKINTIRSVCTMVYAIVQCYILFAIHCGILFSIYCISSYCRNILIGQMFHVSRKMS